MGKFAGKGGGEGLLRLVIRGRGGGAVVRRGG